jgi:hypothetical protein
MKGVDPYIRVNARIRNNLRNVHVANTEVYISIVYHLANFLFMWHADKWLNRLYQWFSTFVRPWPGKVFFLLDEGPAVEKHWAIHGMADDCEPRFDNDEEAVVY